MVQIPTLVQELNLRNQTNAVIMDTARFTIEQFNLFFTASNPAPAKLTSQLADCRSAYDRMNASYAMQMKSLDTSEIKSMDDEGDQLVYAVTGTVEAFMRMTFDAEKQRKAQVFNEFIRKYKIDTRENMISEWSKIQQACEEWAESAVLQEAATALGLAGAMARLQAIATTLRQTITQRSAEAPEAQAMQKAREAFYPEYRTLILLLNAFAAVDEDATRFSQLIGTLNRNIDYVRIHAMSGTSASGGSGTGGSGTSGGTSTDGGSTDPGTTTDPENPGTGGGGSTDPGTTTDPENPGTGGGGTTPDPSQGGGGSTDPEPDPDGGSDSDE